MDIKKMCLIACVVALVGCTVPVKNYSPTMRQSSYPPIQTVNTVGVGEHMLKQGTTAKSEALNVVQRANFMAVVIQPGLYLKMGEDGNGIYYYPFNNIPDGASLTYNFISLMYDKKKDKICAVDVGNNKFCISDVISERKEVEVKNDNAFQNTLIYNGRIGSQINLGYREFSNNLARPAFSNDVSYDLKESRKIGYKGALIEVIDADNRSITYRVLKNFTDTP